VSKWATSQEAWKLEFIESDSGELRFYTDTNIYAQTTNANINDTSWHLINVTYN